MKTILAFLMFVLVACDTDVKLTLDAAEPATEAVFKKGIVSCDSASSHALCKECGWGAPKNCCPAGWTCDVLCSEWKDVYDDKGNRIVHMCVTGS